MNGIPVLSWEKLVEGRRSRGSGDAARLRLLLWRWAKTCESASHASLRRADHEAAARWISSGAAVATAFIQLLALTRDEAPPAPQHEGSRVVF